VGSPSDIKISVVDGLPLWGQWVVANMVGELLGLWIVGIVCLSLTVYRSKPTGSMAVVGVAGLMIALGAFEGAVIGVPSLTDQE
jgi:uncharacterized membrane protein